jgi:hypothetical protein
MPTIQDFIQTAEKEYNVGAENHKYRLGEVEPQLLETEDCMDFYLKPMAGSLFNPSQETCFNLSEYSFRQYCQRLSPVEAKLDSKYLYACPPKLALAQLQAWKRVHREREALFRLHKDPHTGRVRVRAVLSSLYVPLDAVPVGRLLEAHLGDREIEYAVTDRRWMVTFWESMESHANHQVGFRVLGSEVGALRRLRMDVLLKFWLGGKGYVTVPVLIDGRSLASIPYTGAGATGMPKLIDNTNRGLQIAESAKEAADQRKSEELKYPVDEFMDVVTLHRLPSSLKGVPIEQTNLFEETKTKFDLACLFGKLANEASGKAKLRIETTAALYLLTGRAKSTRNRNDEE